MKLPTVTAIALFQNVETHSSTDVNNINLLASSHQARLSYMRKILHIALRVIHNGQPWRQA